MRASLKSPESLHAVHIQLDASIEEALVAFERAQLPNAIQRDELVQWVLSFSGQPGDAGDGAAKRGGKQRPTLLVATPVQVVAGFIHQAQDLILPYYAMALHRISSLWRSAEQLISRSAAALLPENLDASARLTADHLATRAAGTSEPSEPSVTPEARLILDAARNDPETLRLALRELLEERHETFTAWLAQINGWWQTWRGEVASVKECFDTLDAFTARLGATSPSDWEVAAMSRMMRRLRTRSVLRTQMEQAGVSLAPYPEQHAQELISTATLALNPIIAPFRVQRTPGVATGWNFPLAAAAFPANTGAIGKGQLIKYVAAKANKSAKETTELVNATLEVIRESLEAGDDVRLAGFGAFSVRETAARVGVSPQTRTKISVPSRKRVKFTPGKELNDAVASQGAPMRRSTKAAARRGPARKK